MYIYKNNQEVFDKVQDAVLQGSITAKNVDSCNYPSYAHTPTGCFIGLLLEPDLVQRLQDFCDKTDMYAISELQDLCIESCLDSGITPNGAVFEVAEVFQNCDSYFLEKLQNIHDSFEPAAWLRELNHIIRVFNLNLNFHYESERNVTGSLT